MTQLTPFIGYLHKKSKHCKGHSKELNYKAIFYIIWKSLLSNLQVFSNPQWIICLELNEHPKMQKVYTGLH